MEKNVKRISSIELLKLIALFIITISHTLPSGNGLYKMGVSSTNVYSIIFNIFVHFGYIGNVIFIMCSSYFFIDSDKVKKNKVTYLILNIFVISIMILLLKILVWGGVNYKEILNYLIPLTMGKYWFISCYILFYLIHPYLNKIINSLNKKNLLRLIVVLTFIYVVIQFFKPKAFYFNNLIGFIIIYFYIAYLKKYLSKFRNNMKANIIICILSIILLIAFILIINYIGVFNPKFNKLLKYFLFNLVNPFYLMLGVSLINIFTKIKFYNSIVNYFSSCSLFYYIISPNLFEIFFRKKYYKFIMSVNYKVLWVIIVCMITYIISMFVAALYNLIILPIIKIINNKIYNIFKKKYLALENKLLKIN